MNTTDQANQSAVQVVSIVQLVFYVTIFVMGGLGNILVLLVIKAKKNLRKTNDYFILNLALGDVLVLFVSIPVDFYKKIYSLSSGIILCKFLWPFMTSGLLTSVFTLTCMAVERCRVICTPAASKLNGRRLFCVILMIWIAAVLCVLPLVIVAAPDPLGDSCLEEWPSMDMRKIYTTSLVVLQYILPLLIISIAYSMISYRLKISKQFRISSMADVSCRQLQRHRNENSKINKNLRTIVILFAIFMLPKHIAWLWLDFGQGDHYEHFDQVLIFAEVMLYIHSSFNPLVYGTIMKDYRAGFKRYLRRVCCCHFSNQSITISPVQKNATSHQGSLHLCPQDLLPTSPTSPVQENATSQQGSLHLSPRVFLPTSPVQENATSQQGSLHLSPHAVLP
jgi:hypothetical protein